MSNSVTYPSCLCSYFSYNHPPPTEIYTLSLHDALPIWLPRLRLPGDAARHAGRSAGGAGARLQPVRRRTGDRKSTRLNSSHVSISYAVFCLKKKTTRVNLQTQLTSTRVPVQIRLKRSET